MTTKEFNSYFLVYWSNVNAGLPNAKITLSYNDQTVGYIYFYSQIPANCNKLTGGGAITICYPISRFNDVINILRYEKPLYIQLNEGNLSGNIMTSWKEGEGEPVGEEEA